MIEEPELIIEREIESLKDNKKNLENELLSEQIDFVNQIKNGLGEEIINTLKRYEAANKEIKIEVKESPIIKFFKKWKKKLV